MEDRVQSGSDKIERRGALVLTLGAIGSAFGVAACCALPMLLATAGIGTAWLTGIAMVSLPYRNALMIISLLALLASAALLWRIERNVTRCGDGAARTPRWQRMSLLAGLLVGMGLLAAGYLYA
ncbi:mercuric ion transport protein [Novosphingobium kunmingense]|uniref:Mercuric ion transport protein n=1 Tax=Novosphingobium kunmingense TaxID=1211806 RepID=A0A2N0H7M1_9SPHN|nr:mercuric reductase [Novosphingobium kunmingense]PKB14943.1 mercuric ion transport protein [Novosphingobium kunmingense]